MPRPRALRDFPPELVELAPFGRWCLGAVDDHRDGDTLVVIGDLGQKQWPCVPLRLLGWSTPEEHEPGGPEAKAFFRRQLPVGTKIAYFPIAKERAEGEQMTFDRYLAHVMLPGRVDLVARLRAEAEKEGIRHA